MNSRSVYSIFNITILSVFSCSFIACSYYGEAETVKEVSIKELKAQLMEKSSNLDEDDLCLKEIKEFKNLILVGNFASDLGCTNFTPYYGGVKKQFSKEFNTQLMSNSGYSESPEKLIKAFHLRIVNIENTQLSALPEDSDSTLTTLFYPYSLEIEDDTYISKVWIRHPSGMMPEDKYSESIATFDKSTGAFIEEKRENTVTIEMY